MKKLLIAALLCFCSFFADAQFTLQRTLGTDTTFTVVNLLLSGRKYCFVDYTAHKVILYNLNYTIWKVIPLPTIPGLSDPTLASGMGYISENFFKIDNKVDLLVGYSDTGATSGTSGYLALVDETGSILQRIDSVSNFEIHNIGVDSFVAFIYFRHTFVTSIYSLPGTIPCNICGSGLGLGVPPGGNSNGGSSLISNPVPNPSSGSVKIEYSVPPGTNGTIRVFNTMGKELKNYKVDHNFDYITLDNTELPSGIYYYNLTTSDMQTSAKKMIVVR